MKFSIRDLLYITMIIASALGWGLDHRKVTTRTSAFLEDRSQSGKLWVISDASVDASEPLVFACGVLAVLAFVGWLLVRFKLFSQFKTRDLAWLLALSLFLAGWGVDRRILAAKSQQLKPWNRIRD